MCEREGVEGSGSVFLMSSSIEKISWAAERGREDWTQIHFLLLISVYLKESAWPGHSFHSLHWKVTD